MTDDERRLLSDLADRIANTPPPPRDPDAEQLIRTRIGSRPDALYLMTQTVLIQNIALQQAHAQIQQLQQGQGNQIGAGGSFLGNQQRSQPQQPQYAPAPPSYAAPSPSGPGPSVGGGAGSSFLKGAAQTAAGVAAGALAFEGIQSLFGGHHGFGGGGGFFGGGGIGGYAPPIDETVVNNYYDNGSGNNPNDNYGGDNRDDYQAADDATDNSNDQFDDSGSYDDSGNGGDDGGGFDNSGGDNFV